MSMFKTIFTHFNFWIMILYHQTALSGIISIQGDPELTFHLEENNITIEGHVEFTHLGDETALDVFPEIQVGGWVWKGTAQRMQPQAKYRWDISSKTSLSDWDCVEKHCQNTNLPDLGTYPMIVRRYYQDLNGYPFSKIIVKDIQIGTNNKPQSPLQLPITGQLDVRSYGHSFSAKLSLENLSSNMLEVVPTLYAAKEIHIPSDQEDYKLVRISPNEKITLNFQGENRGALLNSTHNIFAVVAWSSAMTNNNQSLRQMRVFFSPYQVLKSKNLPYYWVLAIFIAFLLGIVLVRLKAFSKNTS